MESEVHAETVLLDNGVLVEDVSVIVGAQASNVDLTDVEPLVENVWLDKVVSMACVQELAHLNVSEVMEPFELVVGTDVEVVVVVAQQASDVETEFVNAIPTVRTNTVAQTVVVELVELVLETMLFAKTAVTPSLNNVELFVNLLFEWK